MDDVTETVNTLLNKVHVAKLLVDKMRAMGEDPGKDEWVETTPEIIAHFMREGLGKAGYFIYQGVKICPYGMREKIMEEHAKPMQDRLHPQAGKVQQGTVAAASARERSAS